MFGLFKIFFVYIFQSILLFQFQCSKRIKYPENLSLKRIEFPAQNNNLTLVYSPPKIDVKFANVTFGSSRFNSETDPELKFLSLGQMIANICQADLINRNKTEFSFKGAINLIYQDYKSIQSSGQAAILSILSNDLEGGDDSFQNIRKYSANITGFVGINDYGTAKINSLATNNFGIPTLSAGDLARSNPDNDFSGFFSAERTTLLQIYNTLNYNSFTAILDILKFFKWGLVGNIFTSNNYGYERQMNVDDFSANFSFPIFACQTLFYSDLQTNNDSGLNNFCKCINEKSKIQVIILWMGTPSAISVILKLRNLCDQSKDWTFIIAEDFQTPLNYTPFNEVLKNSLLLRANGPWDVPSFIDDCLDGASPSTKLLIHELIEDFTLTGYNCTSLHDDKLEKCKSLYQNKNKLCFCPKILFASDPYIVSIGSIISSNLYLFIISLE